MQNDCSSAYSLKQLLISDSELLPVHVNRQAEIAEKEVAVWARSIDISLPHMGQILDMASFLYPTTDVARLTIIGKMMFLLFYIDDVYGDLPSAQGLQTISEDVSSQIENYCNTFTATNIPELPDKVVSAFLHVRDEMENYASEAWMKRFSESLANHLRCSAKPSLYGWNAHSQSINTYISVREQISGMYPTIDFIEFANGLFVPQHLILQPMIQRLRLNCARIACLTNDLFSYHKEIDEQGLLLNLVQVMQSVFRCSFGEAVEQSIELINQTTVEFLDDMKIAREYAWNSGTAANIAIETFLIGLHYQISATWHWQINTNRYRSPSSPFEDLRIPLQRILS